LFPFFKSPSCFTLISRVSLSVSQDYPCFLSRTGHVPSDGFLSPDPPSFHNLLFLNSLSAEVFFSTVPNAPFWRGTFLSSPFLLDLSRALVFLIQTISFSALFRDFFPCHRPAGEVRSGGTPGFVLCRFSKLNFRSCAGSALLICAGFKISSPSSLEP